jgi:hypothetical protein
MIGRQNVVLYEANLYICWVLHRNGQQVPQQDASRRNKLRRDVVKCPLGRFPHTTAAFIGSGCPGWIVSPIIVYFGRLCSDHV